jgi:para-nitrobenzyl esterase
MSPANYRISRRAFLANASMAALALKTNPLRALPGSDSIVVKTPSGTLRGQSVDKVNIFRGVPFAEPPVGALRFRPTVASKPWTGERDATKFAASAMQWKESTAFGEQPFVHSEDCLYLNIWAPEGKGPFPVFVWIHGGGYISGHAFGPIHDGSEFARQGIISVTLPYRLGVFGFLDLGPLLDSKGDADYNGSANNALRDLMTALQWIQKNISAFGGNPDRVTIGGESAGAKVTDILMGIPAAQPLFHQMISESGGAERVWSKASAAAVSKGYGELWRKQSGLDLAALKMAPAENLIAVQHDFLIDWPQHFPLRPEIDDTLLPQMPVKAIAAGSSKGKRLLIGTNRDESALFIGPHPDIDPAPKDLGNIPLAKFAPVLQQYKHAYPQMEDFRTRIRAVTAEEYWIPSIRVADALVEGGGTAFMYRLDFTESNGHLSGFAYHSLDVPLVWDRPHPNTANLNEELALGKQVHLAWAAFIRGETPAAPGLPAWPEYNVGNRPTMILDVNSRVEQKPNEAELRLWDGVL